MESDTSKSFSPSKLDTYQNCALRYRYRYIDKIRRDTQSVEAFVGTCVHAAFEALYDRLMHGKTLSEDETLRVFDEEWESGFSERIVLRDKQYTPEDWKKLGRDCVRSYYREAAPFTRDKTVGVERKVSFPLKAGESEYLIQGFVDRLALAPDGALEVHDYKTGRTVPAQAELDADWQLALYELAVRHAWPDTKEVRLVWHYVRHGMTLVSRRTPEELEALKGAVASLIETIKRDHDFSPRKSALCDWCEYRDICPLWAHAEKVSQMSFEQLKKDEGVRLVDELAGVEARKRELRDKLKELDGDAKALESAILRFAEALGLSAVAGLDGEATISQKEEVKFPTKTHSPEALEALERELKETPLWKEVSHLDAHRLLEGYKRREWPEPIRHLVESLIERYATRTREKVVRFRKKREVEED